MAKQEKAVIIPSTPADQEALKKAVIDISGLMEIAAAKRAVIKEAVDAVAEEYDVPKNIVRKLARTHYAQNFNSAQAQNEDFKEAYETIMIGKAGEVITGNQE